MSVLQSNMPHGAVTKAMFSFSLHPDKASSLIFGNYDLAKYAAANSTDDDIVWADIAPDNRDNWVIPLAAIKLKGGADNINLQSKDIFMIPDSGTTFATIPKGDAENLVKLLGKHGISCEMTTEGNYEGFY